jgi:hypothetical protein
VFFNDPAPILERAVSLAVATVSSINLYLADWPAPSPSCEALHTMSNSNAITFRTFVLAKSAAFYRFRVIGLRRRGRIENK